MDFRLIVIDTQCLFDWMLFRNPMCAPWATALSCDKWKWVFTSQMKAEFDFVLAQGLSSGRWTAQPELIATTWASYGHRVAEPDPPGAAARLICTDPDDQKFIDLAIAIRAHTLMTRDKALLKLGRRAWQRHGLRICKPDTWSNELAPASTPDHP